MTYNYYFEIAAILMMLLILFHYRNKMKFLKLDSRLFFWVMIVSIVESIVNLTSSTLLEYSDYVPVIFNIFVAVLFFIFQATKIYMLVLFSFAYMNPKFNIKSRGFLAATVVYGVNLFLSVTTPWTGFYFYFDETGRYIQGYGSDMGYYFYFVNVFLCLIYVFIYRKSLVMKDIMVAWCVAVFVLGGVTFQYINRSTLLIGFAVALAVLYLYMTLENPNDYQDRLTHCGNDYAFRMLIDRKCMQQRTYSVLFLDIRKFHTINAIYGIETGDFLLQKVAGYLEKLFAHQVVYRFHNDIFAVVFNCEQAALEEYTEKIISKFKEFWRLPDGSGVQLDPVITVCEYPEYFCSHTELLKLQGKMNREIKERHNVSILFSDTDMAAAYRRENQIKEILNHALKNRNLEVYYQPIIDSCTGKVVSLEALSRLKDGKLGVIPPDEFIPVAEETGDIIALGFYVLEEVCAFIKEHLLTNQDNTVENIHVNLSALQCIYPMLSEQFGMIIEEYGIPVSMIHMELTESTMLESPEMVAETMKKMIGMGMEFALDDYGTGYSNISYLIRFPFEKIKFDKNLVWSFFTESEAKTVMQNEFQILRQLKKDIIVEGVETEEQYQELKAEGIHLFQGYYFSRPLPGGECVRFLREFSIQKTEK